MTTKRELEKLARAAFGDQGVFVRERHIAWSGKYLCEAFPASGDNFDMVQAGRRTRREARRILAAALRGIIEEKKK